LFAFQRIAANQFAESVGLVRRRSFLRPHLVQSNTCARFSSLESGLTPGETCPNDVYLVQSLF
jgi:hypothetical protein